MSSRKSLITLIAANLLPIVGVLLFDWKIFEIVWLYWVETLIIGAFTLAKLKTIAKFLKASSGPAMFFFCIHFGIFAAAHGFVISVLFSPEPIQAWQYIGGVLGGVMVAVAGLFISHMVAYKNEFLEGEKFKKLTLGQQMSEPYSRIIIMQAFVVLGGAFMQATFSKSGSLIVIVFFVGVKLWWELRQLEIKSVK